MGFQIGKHNVSNTSSPFIIAEAGVHHFGSLALAKEYVLQAHIAGAHSIKFQTYTADKLVTQWAPLYWNDENYENQYQVFSEKKHLTYEDYVCLFEYAKDLGILLLSTPFDIGSADMLEDLGMEAYKIASADLTNTPLLECVAKKNKPVLLSTGASNFEEIEHAVETISEHNTQISLLHCSLAYPTPINQANLLRIKQIQNKFPNVVLGYSDHTQPQNSDLACPLAVSLGARVIEKHFTLNEKLDGDDHYHSVNTKGLAELVYNCEVAYQMCSTSQEITEVEMAARHQARRSVVAKMDIAEGTIITEEHLDYKRPGHGLSPEKVNLIIGKKAAHSIKYDDLIQEVDVI